MFNRYDLIWIATLIGALVIQFRLQPTSMGRLWKLGECPHSSVEVDRIYRREVRRLWTLAALAIALYIATVWIAVGNRP